MTPPPLPPLDPAAFGPSISGTDALDLACDTCHVGVAEPCRPTCLR